MQTSSESEETGKYYVVINDEEQYSIWPEWVESLPAGWSKTGFSGSKQFCIEHVDTVWTDMRPKSLRTAR